MSVLLALVSNLAASRRGNEHVVTFDFVVVFVVVVCPADSLQKITSIKFWVSCVNYAT